MKTYIQNAANKMQQSKNNTSHFENDLGAYLLLNNANDNCLNNLFISL